MPNEAWAGLPAAPIDPYAQNDPYAADPYAALQQVPVWKDIAKTAGPSTVRGLTAAVTGIPSMADLAALGVGKAAEKLQPTVISPETAKTVQSGAEAFQKHIAPATYGEVMKDIQEGMPSIGFKGTGPLYEATTPGGKVVENTLQILPSAFGGATGVIPRLAGPATKMLRSLAGGAGITGAGALADAYLPEWAKPWAQAVGGVAGAAGGPAAGRKLITPFPSSVEHAADVKVLKDAGVKGLTAAQVSGSPRLAQFEANLAGPKLAGQDAAAFTQATAAKSGMPGVKSLTPEAFMKAEQGFKQYNDQVRQAEIQPNNFAAMHTELGNIRKDAYKDLRAQTAEHIDPLIAELKGGPGAMSMPGGRYQYMRQQIQGMLGDKSITGTEKKYLSEIKATLDSAMEKELPQSLAEQHKAYANFDILKNTKLDKNRQITPEALHKSIAGQWGEEAYNLGRGLSPMAAAGERVMTRPVGKEEPNRLVQAGSALLGGGVGDAINHQEAIVGAILGREMAPVAQGIGRMIAKPAYFNPIVQSLLKNQLVKPGTATTVDLPSALRMLRGPTAGPIANQSQ